MGGGLARFMQSKEDKELREHIGLGTREVQAIVDSWSEVKAFGAERAGIILFKRLFIAAPETFLMFPDFKDLPDWEESKEFKHHCRIVMNIVGTAVSLLKDPDSLDGTLEYLGLKHEGFAISQQHFDILGVELIHTLREAIGTKLTPAVETAWTQMYKYIAEIIVKGMHRMEIGVARATAADS
jgi:hemoglobin-like flavoprotein